MDYSLRGRSSTTEAMNFLLFLTSRSSNLPFLIRFFTLFLNYSSSLISSSNSFSGSIIFFITNKFFFNTHKSILLSNVYCLYYLLFLVSCLLSFLKLNIHYCYKKTMHIFISIKTIKSNKYVFYLLKRFMN